MSARPRRSDERGIALVLAVFALVVIAALISAVFFTAQLEQRSGTNTIASLQASEAAQAGLEYATATWKRSWVQQGIGSTSGMAWMQLGGTSGYFSDSVTLLNKRLVLVRAFGEARNSGGSVLASRTSGMLFTFGPADFGVRAAFTTNANATLGGVDTVSGVDITPPSGAWATQCAGLTKANQAALRGGSQLYGSGSSYGYGPFAVSYDASVAATMTKVDKAFSALAPLADITLYGSPASIQPALTAGHTCDQTRSDNWGDPTYAASGTWGATHPCASYFPVIYYGGGGTFTLPSGSGQGILLVDGDLQFGSGFKFYGIIIVTGTAQASGGSNGNIYGALISQSGWSLLTGDERLDYSSCAVTFAQQSAMLGTPLAQRPYIRY